MSVSNGAQRSLQHERSNAVELENTENLENRYRMHTHAEDYILGICYNMLKLYNVLGCT